MSEHHDGNLHIRNSVGVKFQLKLIILSLRSKLTPKKYFQSKKKIKTNITTEFFIFELVEVSNFALKK